MKNEHRNGQDQARDDGDNSKHNKQLDQGCATSPVNSLEIAAFHDQIPKLYWWTDHPPVKFRLIWLAPVHRRITAEGLDEIQLCVVISGVDADEADNRINGHFRIEERNHGRGFLFAQL